MKTKNRKSTRKSLATRRTAANLRFARTLEAQVKARFSGKHKALAKDSIPRAPLAYALQDRITRLGLNRNDAAKATGEAASQISRLMTGYVTDFSADRIVKHLLSLGSDVTITVKHGKNPKKAGKVKVVAA